MRGLLAWCSRARSPMDDGVSDRLKSGLLQGCERISPSPWIAVGVAEKEMPSGPEDPPYLSKHLGQDAAIVLSLPVAAVF